MASIRTATPDDASSITRVQIETWRTTYRGIVPDAYLAGLNAAERASQWRDHLQSPGRIFVAELDAQVVGFIDGGPIREPLKGYDAELYAIYLLLKTQRMGIGTALVKELAGRLLHEGFHSMAVWAFEANPAVRFYQRLGAVPVPARQREFGGAFLPLAGHGWPDLNTIAPSIKS